jgi:hypothetical protein
VFNDLPVLIVGFEKLTRHRSLFCPGFPHIGIGKRIEQGIVVHRGSILEKFDRVVLVVLDADNQAVVVEGEVFESVKAITIDGIELIHNAWLDPITVGII